MQGLQLDKAFLEPPVTRKGLQTKTCKEFPVPGVHCGPCGVILGSIRLPGPEKTCCSFKNWLKKCRPPFFYSAVTT